MKTETLLQRVSSMLALMLCLCAPMYVVAEEAPAPLTKDQRLNLLKIEQAQLKRDQAESEQAKAQVELAELQTLFDEKVITIEKLNKAKQEYERAVLAFKQAEIDLERTRLEFLTEATLITVVGAKKSRGKDKQVFAEISLRNDSDVSKARIAMGDTEGVSDGNLAALLKIDNIIVTIKDGSQYIVGDPFQQIVPELQLGEEVKLKYQLLNKSVEDITIQIQYLNTTKTYTVYMQKKSSQQLPTVSSTQYALQGQLGSKIRYDLELERLAETEKSFPLIVLNFPQEIPFAFLDPQSGARISQVKFSGERPKQSLDFEVSIPEKLDQSFIDASVDFTIMVVESSELKTINELQKEYRGKKMPPEVISKIKGKKLELILIPKGVGDLEILVTNSFKEVLQGDEVEFKLTMLNSGTLALRNVRPEIDVPLEWEDSIEPKEADFIEPGDKVIFTARAIPPSDVKIGEYSVKIEAEGYSGVETVEAVDKNFKIRVVRESNITGTLILVIILIVLVLGISIASIKIARR